MTKITRKKKDPDHQSILTFKVQIIFFFLLLLAATAPLYLTMFICLFKLFNGKFSKLSILYASTLATKQYLLHVLTDLRYLVLLFIVTVQQQPQPQQQNNQNCSWVETK